MVPQGQVNVINGHTFTGFSSHCDNYPYTYLTAAAAIGMTKDDVDAFIKRLDKVLAKAAVKVEPKKASCDAKDHTIDASGDVKKPLGS